MQLEKVAGKIFGFLLLERSCKGYVFLLLKFDFAKFCTFQNFDKTHSDFSEFMLLFAADSSLSRQLIIRASKSSPPVASALALSLAGFSLNGAIQLNDANKETFLNL